MAGGAHLTTQHGFGNAIEDQNAELEMQIGGGRELTLEDQLKTWAQNSRANNVGVQCMTPERKGN